MLTVKAYTKCYYAKQLLSKHVNKHVLFYAKQNMFTKQTYDAQGLGSRSGPEPGPGYRPRQGPEAEPRPGPEPGPGPEPCKEIQYKLNLLRICLLYTSDAADE